MRTFEELSAEMDAILANLSEEEIARDLMEFGVEFDTPPRARGVEAWPAGAINQSVVTIKSFSHENASGEEGVFMPKTSAAANSNELALAA